MENPIKSANWILFLSRVFKRIPLPFYRQIPLYKFLAVLYVRNSQHGLSDRAAGLTFYFLLATPSFLLCLLNLSAFIPFLSRSFNGEILQLIHAMSPDETTYGNISNMFKDLFEIKNRSSLSISVLLTFFFASNIVMGAQKAFHKALGYKKTLKTPYPLYTRIKAFKNTLILLLIIWLAISLLIVQKAFFRGLFHQWYLHKENLSLVYRVLQVLTISIVMLISTAIIYRYIPNSKKRLPFFSAGAIFCSLVYLLLLCGFSYWVNNYVSYNRIFGSLGTLIIVLFSAYFFSYILLLGFEINMALCYFLYKSPKI